MLLSRGGHHCGVLPNLFHKIEEVAVSIRSVGRTSLIAFVEIFDGCVDTLYRGLAEIEVRSLRNGPFLQVSQETMSKVTFPEIERCTYRSQEDECLLQVTETSDLLLTDAPGYTMDERMEVFERFLPQDWGYYVFLNLLGSVIAKELLISNARACSR